MEKQWKQWQTLFLGGFKITEDGDCSHEIKRCLLLGRKAVTNPCCCSVPQSCLTLCDPMDCSRPGSSVLHCLPEFCSNSGLLSRWCRPTTSSSIVPFSSGLKSFPASVSFPMSQFFASGGQSIGLSALASVLPMNIQN